MAQSSSKAVMSPKTQGSRIYCGKEVSNWQILYGRCSHRTKNVEHVRFTTVKTAKPLPPQNLRLAARFHLLNFPTIRRRAIFFNPNFALCLFSLKPKPPQTEEQTILKRRRVPPQGYASPCPTTRPNPPSPKPSSNGATTSRTTPPTASTT